MEQVLLRASGLLGQAKLQSSAPLRMAHVPRRSGKACPGAVRATTKASSAERLSRVPKGRTILLGKDLGSLSGHSFLLQCEHESNLFRCALRQDFNTKAKTGTRNGNKNEKREERGGKEETKTGREGEVGESGDSGRWRGREGRS